MSLTINNTIGLRVQTNPLFSGLDSAANATALGHALVGLKSALKVCHIARRSFTNIPMY